MNKQNTKYFLSSILLLVFLWSGVIIFSAGVLRIPDFTQYSLDATVAVHGGQRVTQQFYSQYNQLSSLGISAKNINLQNKKDLVLTIYDGPILLRTASINGIYISDGKFLRFDFPPIVDSANKMYTFEFSAPTATKEEALEVYLTKQAFSQAGYLQVGQLPYEEYKAVSFVTFHKPPSIGSTIIQILTDFEHRLLQDVSFLVIFIGSIALLLVIGFLKKFDKYFEKLN